MRPLPLSDYVYYLSSPTNTSSFTTGFFNSINNSPPLFSPPLLLDPMLFPTDFNNKNHQPISPPPVNILHPIFLSHRPPPPLLPTTTLPSSGTHLHFPPHPYLHTQHTNSHVHPKIFFFNLVRIHHHHLMVPRVKIPRNIPTTSPASPNT